MTQNNPNVFVWRAPSGKSLPTWVEIVNGNTVGTKDDLPEEYLSKMYPEVAQWGPNFAYVNQFSEFLRKVAKKYEEAPEAATEFVVTWNKLFSGEIRKLAADARRIQNHLATVDPDIGTLTQGVSLAGLLFEMYPDSKLSKKEQGEKKTANINAFFGVLDKALDFDELWAFTRVLENISMVLIGAHLAGKENPSFSADDADLFIGLWTQAEEKFNAI
jgi:hypothetical protein